MAILRKRKTASARPAQAAPEGPSPSQEASASRGKAKFQPQADGGKVHLLIERYGDLIYDLCETILWKSPLAQVVVRSIFRELRAEHKFNPFERHERAWVLHVACRRLRDLSRDHAHKVTASEQLELDAADRASVRLKQFDTYFHRLPVDDQVVLFLRDKYGLPYDELAAVLGVPEGSLKIRRQQALRALEDWIWES
jgi:RNA polymerase sigma factor (sigma-70 family)